MSLARELFHRIPDLPLYHSFRVLGRPVLPPLEMTLAVTRRCKKNCLTCNSWRKKSDDELSAKDYRKFFECFDFPLLGVTVTGGEPFLREDLEEIISCLCEKNSPRFIRLFTGGDDTGAAPRIMKNIVSRFPDVNFAVFVSTEGAVNPAAETLRGGDIADDVFFKTYQGLNLLGYTNLTVGLSLLVSCFNSATATNLIDNAFKLYPDAVNLQFAYGSRELDVYATDVLPDLKELERVKEAFFSNLWRICGSGAQRFMQKVNRLQVIAAAASMNNMKKAVPCYAGTASLYVNPQGVVTECSVTGTEMGDLRETDFRLEPILRSAQARRVRREVRSGGCFCAMSDAAIANCLLRPRCYAALTAAML